MAKSSLARNRKFPSIKKELTKLYGERITKHIVRLAESYYTDCAELCKGASHGEWQHLSGTILPTVAFYKALQDMDPKHALSRVHFVMMELCKRGGTTVADVMDLPGMQSAFMWLLPRLASKMFGPACGFLYKNYSADKNHLRMDMTACPYCHYTRKLGCPELMPVFCDSDFATYGDLPGIRFERTQTLGTGGNCCDFQFSRR